MYILRRAVSGQVYYGWIMLGAVSITEVVSWGILYYAFTVFVAPMEAELGWSRVEITGGFSLALLCSGIAALPAGQWLDRHGPRVLMTAGSVLGSLLLVAWSAISSLWTFYLVMAGLGVVTAAVLYEPAFAIVAIWFRQYRGRALTILTFFGAWASFLFIPLSAWLVQRLSWRPALLVLAGILALVTIPLHALLLRRRPQDLGLLPDGQSSDLLPTEHANVPEPNTPVAVVVRQAEFWWLTWAFATSTFAAVAMTVHIIPYLVEHGHSPTFAASVAGLHGIMSLAGRLILGPLGDRYTRHRVAAGLMALQLVGLATLALSPGTAGAIMYITLFGAGAGTMTIMRAALLAEQYGSAQYGSINGTMSFALTGAKTFAPVGAGVIASHLGGYSSLLWSLAGLVLLGLVALLRTSK